VVRTRLLRRHVNDLPSELHWCGLALSLPVNDGDVLVFAFAGASARTRQGRGARREDAWPWTADELSARAGGNSCEA
jgi:hypothetical protein